MKNGTIELLVTILLIALIFQSPNQQVTLGSQATLTAAQGDNQGSEGDTQASSSFLNQASGDEFLVPVDKGNSRETVDLGRPARGNLQLRPAVIEPLADHSQLNSAPASPASFPRRSQVTIQAYTPIDPIYINGNADFAAKNITHGWLGDGSKSRPYIITGRSFTNKSSRLFDIENTDVYFEFKDNVLDGINGTYSAVNLHNVSHGIVANNTINNSRLGVGIGSHDPINPLWLSANNTISRNDIFNSSVRGIEVYSSNQTVISNNYCYNSTLDGIYLAASNYSTIFNNTVYWNGWAGIRLEPIFSENEICIENDISNNTAFDNIETGILLIGASKNTVANNSVHHNAWHGIWAENFADDNVITSNTAYNNSGQNIRVWNSTNNEISYNTIHDSTGSGMFIVLADDTSIFNNTAFACGWNGMNDPDSYAAGITVGNSTNVDIHTNTLFDNPDLGIQVWDSKDTSIWNNSVTDSLDLGIFAFNANTTTIDDNKVLVSGSDGIFLNWSHHSTISDNIVSDSAIGGIGLNWSDNSEITNNTITDSHGSGEGNGIRLYHSNHSFIYDNRITNSAASGLAIGWATNSTITQNTVADRIILWYAEKGIVSGNTVPFSDSNGIYLFESNASSVTTNTVSNSARSGIVMYDSHYSNVSGNDVTHSNRTGIWLESSIQCNVSHNTVADNADEGIYLWESNRSIITHNEIFRNGANGIYLENTSYCTISGNIVYDNGTGSSGATWPPRSVLAGGGIGNGVYLDPSFHIVLSNNDINNNAVDGVSLYECDNITISSNSIHNNGADGVFLEDSDANNIIENDILNNGKGNSSLMRFRRGQMTILAGGGIGNGVYLDPSSYNTIANNTISGNNANGIFLFDSDINGVHYNLVLDNGLYGINITEGSSDNTVRLNDFYNNNLGGTSQALDNGFNNQFSNNFWADHDNTDIDGDGIADAPYLIDGTASNLDNSSMSAPNHPPMDFLGVPWVVYPNGGETLSGTVSIRWSAAVDLLRHPVTYAVYYSPNNGDSWSLLAGTLTSTSYPWDTSGVSDGSHYLVRVVATCSGRLSTHDESDETFSIQNALPDSSEPPSSIDDRESSEGKVSPGWTIPVVLASIATLLALRRFKGKPENND
ncbi:MAG: right-handed parallel beta-helix repeat-containing protein [Candidatus Heimdallarchaeota archaeon]